MILRQRDLDQESRREYYLFKLNARDTDPSLELEARVFFNLFKSYVT